jgi:lipopolysaccharide cholinephosphotransferase
MNLECEIRKGYTISAEMKKVWSIQMKLVKKLLEVCKKYNLKIWADGGTLLGTVRDQGYIPWDDDIDMVMLRGDYDKLVHIASKEFREPFFFQNAYTDKLYPRGHSQLRYNGTAAILPGDIYCKFNQSIFIDVFVYDALPKDKNYFTANLLKAEFLREIMIWRTYTRCKPFTMKYFMKRLASKLFFAVFNFHKIFHRFEQLYSNSKLELSDIYSCPTFNLSLVFKIARKKEWYSDTIYMPFEDIQMPVPKGYDKILTNQYGDYMTPVKAPSMHGSVIFDTKRPYTEVLKDIKSGKIDIKKYLK